MNSQFCRSVVLSMVVLWGALGVASAAPLPALFTDPGGYPAAWPGFAASYPSQGAAQLDLEFANGDVSSGPATFLDEQDFSSANGTATSVFYTADGSVLFFRLRLESNPLETGKDGPFKPTRWNILLDSDGDGFKEFIVQLNGASPNTFITQPDNLVTYFNDTATQVVNPGTDRLWEQDAGGPSDGIDGGLYPDTDASAFIWDFGRTRVTQINTGLPAGDAASEFFLDIQVPLGALNGGGVNELTAANCAQLAVATSNSGSNPVAQDLIYQGTFAVAGGGGSEVPFGDVIRVNGDLLTAPVVKSVTAPVCGAAMVLNSVVFDALIDDGASGVQDSLNFVRFEFFQDLDANNLADDVGVNWVPIANGVTGSFVSEFTTTLDSTVLPALPGGQYLVRVIAEDDQANTTDSFVQIFPGSRFGVFDNTGCGTTGGTLTGTIYQDDDVNSAQNGSESGTGVAFFAKLVNQAAPGTAVLAVPVDLTTGDFTIFTPVTGTFDIVIDNNATLADITPTTPGFAGTEAPTGIRAGVVVAPASIITDQDFGLYPGSVFVGRVFRDDGVGGATPNDGTQNLPSEVGISAVEMELQDGAGTVLQRTRTDANGDFRFAIPASVGAVALRVVERGPSPRISTGANLGNTGGTYVRANDRLEFTNTVGASFSGVQFGDVDPPLFTENHQEQSRGGIAIFYPHRFLPGSGGDVTYSVTEVANPAINGWTATLYDDPDCDGVLAPTDPLITAPVTVTVGIPDCTVLRVFVPQGTPLGSKHTATVQAAFAYTNAAPALSTTLENVDVTGVGEADGLELVKAVDVTTAQPGDNVTYTVTYTNTGSDPIVDFVLSDSTPGFTTYVSGAEGPLPAGIAVLRTEPAPGAVGPVVWTFTGTLVPLASGTVTFVVQID